MLNDHVLLPHLSALSEVDEPYRGWLRKYSDQTIELAERGIAHSAGVVAGYIAGSLSGAPKGDWLAVMRDLLELDGMPLAYSKEYGQQLCSFDNQWQQTDVHSVYARYWLERSIGEDAPERYSEIVRQFVQKTGWIFNPLVSETRTEKRMRSELLMQMAMAIEIAMAAGDAKEHYSASLAAIAGMGNTRYVSAEYFRLVSLLQLEHLEQMVAGADEVLTECHVAPGFSDFNVSAKRDDYMGTLKRSERDIAPFSPLCTVYALELAGFIRDKRVEEWKTDISKYLVSTPLEISPFRMRDLLPAFGDGCTTYEAIAECILRELAISEKK